jgi:hypothetical protein
MPASGWTDLISSTILRALLQQQPHHHLVPFCAAKCKDVDPSLSAVLTSASFPNSRVKYPDGCAEQDYLY